MCFPFSCFTKRKTQKDLVLFPGVPELRLVGRRKEWKYRDRPQRLPDGAVHYIKTRDVRFSGLLMEPSTFSFVHVYSQNAIERLKYMSLQLLLLCFVSFSESFASSKWWTTEWKAIHMTERFNSIFLCFFVRVFFFSHNISWYPFFFFGTMVF